MLVLSALAFAFGFVTNVLLGRTGPEALGFYNFLIVTLSLVSGFFLFGGNHVVITYLPGLDRQRRSRFLRTYAAIVVVVAVALLGVCALFPSLLHLLYGRSVSDVPLLRYLALLLPVGVAQMLAWSLLQADLRLRRLAISQQLVSVLTCIGILLAFVLPSRSGASDHLNSRGYLLFTVLAANVVSVIAAVRPLRRRRTSHSTERTERLRAPFLPRGFWAFALSFHASTILYFLIRTMDQLFVLHRFGLVELGYYRSAFVVAQLVAWFSVVTDWVVYPAFCNLDHREHGSAYARFALLNSVGTSLIGGAIILLSHQVLNIFGRSASPTSHSVLLILAASTAVAAPFVSLNNSAIMARGSATLVLVENLVGAAAGIAAYIVFGTRFGLVGVGVGFAVLQGVLLVVSTLMAWRVVAPPFRFPMRALATSVVTVAYALVVSLALPQSAIGTATRVAATALIIALLVAVRLIRWGELEELVRMLLPSRRASTVRPDVADAPPLPPASLR